MTQKTLEEIAEEFAQLRYINGCVNPTGNMISKSIACREGFKAGAQWQRNHVWHDSRKEVPEEKKFCIYILSDGTFGCGYYHKEDNSIWYSRFTDIVKWAYVEDVVPKGGVK